MKTFKVLSPAALAKMPAEPAWLIKGLWAHLGVGIIAGAPKSCKTWLALEMAVSVASNTHCLGTFPVISTGRVLIYMAEDSLSVQYNRLKAISHHKSINIESLNIGILNPDSLRLDKPEDQQRLEHTVEVEKPVLIIFDPLIRMHAIDENSSNEVSKLLSFLRNLQKKYNTAISVVHHARKNGGPAHKQGLGIRGSSDIHAWGDSNLYIRSKEKHLVLTVEQRAAQSIDPIEVKLVSGQNNLPHLEVIGDLKADVQREYTIEDKIVQYLNDKSIPISQNSIRQYLKVRNQVLVEILKNMKIKGTLFRLKKGWVVNTNCQQPVSNGTVPVPTPKKNRERNDKSHIVPVPTPKKKGERNNCMQQKLPFVVNSNIKKTAMAYL